MPVPPAISGDPTSAAGAPVKLHNVGHDDGAVGALGTDQAEPREDQGDDCGGEDLEEALKEMLAAKTPFFLEAVVGKEDNVFPMVPAGAGVAEILLETPKG